MNRSEQIAWLALFLGSLASMISGLDHWSDALHPPFVAGLIMNVVSTLKMMYSDKPRADDALGRRTDPKPLEEPPAA